MKNVRLADGRKKSGFCNENLPKTNRGTLPGLALFSSRNPFQAKRHIRGAFKEARALLPADAAPAMLKPDKLPAHPAPAAGTNFAVPAYSPCSLSFSLVFRLVTVTFRTAYPTAFFVPTSTSSFFARVTPV